MNLNQILVNRGIIHARHLLAKTLDCPLNKIYINDPVKHCLITKINH